MKPKPKYIIGIDEVGRGPLAGPVTVAAVAVTVNYKLQKPNSKLRDSKKLSAKQRELWFDYIKKNKKLFYAISSVSPRTIDKINISKAANLAATRALRRLLMKHRLPRNKIKIFLDGGLKIKQPLSTFYDPHTIIKGDEKIPAIALASIVAKVTRDRKMRKLHKKYPKYGFNKHKGYGTKKHIKAIKKHDLTDIHRKTFSKKFRMIK
ncbi:ribonuclease HII [Patescibacteria group bacterium]|nr:ribonuclease HII [Patescibacteria group bacterium]